VTGSPGGIGGHGSLASGLLIGVHLAGWDATVYVNEAVKHRRHNPGKAAARFALLIAIYTFSQVALQGVVAAKLQANCPPCSSTSPSARRRPGAKVMALALALSVIAVHRVSIVILAG